ncbi:unnamed protein product [Symbiodinium sp. CCMP2592]|nr:unnamed protein product [Symbiodinium sp. CCMP2592]
MGKAGKPWRTGKGAEEEEPYSWRYWRGPWRQAADDSGWYAGAVTPRFPAYDAVGTKGTAKGSAPSTRVETTKDPESMLVKALQDNINQARKAEQRVRTLLATRNKKQEMWLTFLDGMKQAYLQELARHQKDVAKLDTDLETALAVQEQARQQLRVIVTAGPEPVQDAQAMQDAEWEELQQTWQQEQTQVEDAGSVLQRALSACGLDHQKLIAATSRVSQLQAAPRYAVPEGCIPSDPFQLSPTATGPPGLSSRATTPLRLKHTTDKGHRAPIKPVVTPSPKTPVPEKSLHAKLEKAREAAARDEGVAMRPFGVRPPAGTEGGAPAVEPKPPETVDVDQETEANKAGLHHMG